MHMFKYNKIGDYSKFRNGMKHPEQPKYNFGFGSDPRKMDIFHKDTQQMFDDPDRIVLIDHVK